MRTPVPVGVARRVCLALALGLLVFAAVSLGMEPNHAGQPSPATTLLVVLAAVGASTVPAALLLPPRIAARAAQRKTEALAELDAGQLPGEVFVATLVGAALLESFGLLGCVVHLLTRESLALVAPALAAALIVQRLPNLVAARDQVENG